MARAITHHGDAVTWARDYSGPLFHALFCDSPYEMAFMGKGWDGSGVAFNPATWEAFARVLHPGAFLFVFAGTINDDLISVAMREAGLRKFHKMMGWAYGSGFPKASRIDYSQDSEWLSAFVDIPGEVFPGHRYGLQALKPAIETILVFQKPYSGKPLDDITETGAGALNIDGGRVEITDSKNGFRKGDYSSKNESRSSWEHREDGDKYRKDEHSLGRWPSNFLLLDEAAARALDEQSGERPVSGSAKNGRPARGDDYSESASLFQYISKRQGVLHNDSGGASRFFFRVSEQIDEADPVFYSAKASRGERDAGLGDNGLKERATQGRDVVRTIDRKDGRGPVPVNAQIRPARNPHPTVKPLSLCRYLATLLLPPPEYSPRRLFVPFAGSGSEQIGAVMAGWEEVEGVEITEEYIPINRARLKYWQGRPNGSKKPKSSVPANVKDSRQKELF